MRGDVMLEYSATHWVTYTLTVLLMNLSPGPDLALTLSHTVRSGRRAGLAAMLGTLTGVVGHTALAVVGFSAVIAASSEAFAAVKWAGVVYLLWIGFKALRSRGMTLSFAGTRKEPARGWKILRQAAVVNLLNPKVALFFLAFLPQFVEPGAGPVWAQLLLHGLLIVPLAALVTGPLVWLGDRASAPLRASPHSTAWLDRGFGIVLVLLGVRLAMIEQ